jgi:hypothetical protein
MLYNILGEFELNKLQPISDILGEVNKTMQEFGFMERISIKSTARLGTVNASRPMTLAEKTLYCDSFMEKIGDLLPGLISVTLT